MCSVHLTHPSVHTWSSGQPTVQRPGSRRGIPVGAGIRTHNLGLPRVSSPTLYPLGQRLPKALTDDDCSPITIKRHLRENGFNNRNHLQRPSLRTHHKLVHNLQGSTKHGTVKGGRNFYSLTRKS